jgi:hypothetical protein
LANERDPAQRVSTATGTISVGELEARCSVIEPGIVLLREVPQNTSDTYAVMIRRCRELGEAFERWVLVVDLTDATERPKGRYLEAIKECFSGPKPILHLATTQPGSAFLRAVAGFVLARASKNTSAHPTLDAAVTAARKVLIQAGGPEAPRSFASKEKAQNG